MEGGGTARSLAGRRGRLGALQFRQAALQLLHPGLQVLHLLGQVRGGGRGRLARRAGWGLGRRGRHGRAHAGEVGTGRKEQQESCHHQIPDHACLPHVFPPGWLGVTGADQPPDCFN